MQQTAKLNGHCACSAVQYRIVYMGNLAERHAIEPKMNIYCDNKLDWLERLFEIENTKAGIQR